MKKIDRINQELRKSEVYLELMGEEGSYCFVTILGEGTIYFSAFEDVNTRIYKNLKGTLKEWMRRAKGLNKYIQRKMV